MPRSSTQPRETPLSKALAMLDAAVKAGTHSPTSKHYCEGCNQLVDGIYHVTLDRKRICAACADLIGCGPESWDASRNRN